jgi:hypothetical protein
MDFQFFFIILMYSKCNFNCETLDILNIFLFTRMRYEINDRREETNKKVFRKLKKYICHYYQLIFMAVKLVRTVFFVREKKRA